MINEGVGVGTFGFQGELQGGGAEDRFEGVEEVPGNDFAAAKIKGGTEVTPASGGLDVGYIGHPDLVGPGGQQCFL